jgi:hypothetical protein
MLKAGDDAMSAIRQLPLPQPWPDTTFNEIGRSRSSVRRIGGGITRWPVSGLQQPAPALLRH